MSKTMIMDHPLVQHKVSLLRNKNTGTKEFRDLVSEIATLLCYEATRDLPTEEVEIETPIAVAKTRMLSGRKLALVPILRAGLGMVDGMLALIPAAKVGHIGMYRNEETLEPVEYYCKLPDDIVTFQSENYMVNIKCGMSEFNILGTDPEEFPELPTVEYQNSLILPQSRLKAMISQTLFAVSDNESRPIHTGSLFEVDSEGLTIVSVDGYRLALRHESIDKKEGAETFSFVVPGAALSEVEKICSDVDEPASVTQGARHVMFKVGDTMLVSRRLEGEFLAYRQAIPRNNTIHVEGDTRALLSSIDRVSLIISDKLKSPLRCVFGDGLVSITTKTGIGDAADQCPITGDGQELEIGFNNKYLMDALKAAPADRLRLEFSSGVAPCVILPAEGEENFIYMVLPVRLKAN